MLHFTNSLHMQIHVHILQVRYVICSLQLPKDTLAIKTNPFSSAVLKWLSMATSQQFPCRKRCSSSFQNLDRRSFKSIFRLILRNCLIDHRKNPYCKHPLCMQKHTDG
ncbi:hypothetical protein BD560DRAFT_389895 [Blakeslea trispora]|nr:hypothetical protein BD560DRAFT_389895 [Blakeslea trispora]